MVILNKLSPEAIDEKIRLNEENGIDIHRLRESINEEMKDFIWMALRANVQVQFYREQLEHIDNKIKSQSKQC